MLYLARGADGEQTTRSAWQRCLGDELVGKVEVEIGSEHVVSPLCLASEAATHDLFQAPSDPREFNALDAQASSGDRPRLPQSSNREVVVARSAGVASRRDC